LLIEIRTDPLTVVDEIFLVVAASGSAETEENRQYDN